MNLNTIITAAMAFAIFAVAPMRAADSPTGTSTTESSKHMNYHGTITSIDMSANTVTIQTNEGSMTMSFNAATKFRGGTKSLSDLKVGDAITGTYMMDDSGKMMAISVKPYRSKS